MEKTSSLPSLINKSRRGVIPSIRYNNALYRVSNTIIVSNTSSTMRGDAVSIHGTINTQSPALLSSIKIAYPMSCGIIDERVKLREIREQLHFTWEECLARPILEDIVICGTCGRRSCHCPLENMITSVRGCYLYDHMRNFKCDNIQLTLHILLPSRTPEVRAAYDCVHKEHRCG